MKTCLATLAILLADTCLGSVQAICLYAGDGICDAFYNNADCYYDGGDCCECDCDASTNNCGTLGYDCLDPYSSCNYDTFVTYDGTFVTDDAGTFVTDEYGYDSGDNDMLVSEDDDAVSLVNVDDDDGNAAGDDAPLGAIIGGAVGGAVFLGALAVLALCIKTGRLKICCSSGGTAAASAVPTPAQA